MRKLLVFVILALVLVSSLVGACIASDGVKTTVVNILVGIFGPVWIFISTGWSNLALTVGGSGAYFLLYTCVVAIFFIALFVTLSKAKSSGKLSLSKKTSTSVDTGMGTTGMGASTPASATVRPEAKTGPVPKPPPETVVEEGDVE